MTESTQSTAANSNRAYNLAGTVSDINVRTSKTGTPYTVATFTTTLQGRETTRKAMAFGKAHDALAGLVDGPCRLFVKIDGGVFAVIGLGLEPKSAQQAA
jgi:hypothetical protein